MPRSARMLLVAVLLAAGAVPASAGSRPVAQRVAPGYDMFLTPENGARLSLSTPVADVPLMTFRGRPLGTFDFGRLGRHRVGLADTIVRRLDTATPASPKVRIELVGLLLESTNVPGYYATLQSTRPFGLASTGTLGFSFARDGLGGMLRSELTVNYDIRQGSPTGPIVATGSTGMGFVAENVIWQHDTRSAAPDPEPCKPPQDNPVLNNDAYCLYTYNDGDGTHVCHWFPGLSHLHCVSHREGAIPAITGVNYRLNGRDTSNDFHAVGQIKTS